MLHRRLGWIASVAILLTTTFALNANEQSQAAKASLTGADTHDCCALHLSPRAKSPAKCLVCPLDLKAVGFPNSHINGESIVYDSYFTGQPIFAWFSTSQAEETAPGHIEFPDAIVFEAAKGGVRLNMPGGEKMHALVLKKLSLPGKGIVVSSTGKQLQVMGPKVNAVCKRLIYSKVNRRAILVGQVRLKYRQGGKWVETGAGQVVIDLRTGYLQLDAAVDQTVQQSY